MRSLLQDIQYGLRMLAKNPGFTAVAALALALGIGANTAIYSVADVLLFRPLLLRDLDRLVVLQGTFAGGQSLAWQITPADLADFHQQSKTLDHVSAYEWWTANLTGDGEPERVQGFQVTEAFFDALSERPLLGRSFLAEEDRPGRERVVVLSYPLWQRQFAGDPNVLGRAIQINGQAHEVVGVMSKDFRYPAPAELWAPLAMNPRYRNSRNSFDLYAIARLKPGATVQQANAEVEGIARRISEQNPQTHASRGARAALLREYVSGDLTREYTLLLLGTVAFVLLIACANVANLQFGRASARAREMAVRSALGAGRWRLVRMLLTESVLLSLAGAMLGVLLALWGIDLIRGSMPASVQIFLPGWDRMGLNRHVLAYTLALSVGAGILAGVAPALMSSRSGVQQALKEGGRAATAGRGRRRMRSLLVVSQVVLAVVLLVGAGLMVKGLRVVAEPKLNLEADKVLTMKLALPAQYSVEQLRNFQQQLLHSLEAIPAVSGAALVQNLPYSGSSGSRLFTIESRPEPVPGSAPSAQLQVVSGGYFRTLRIPIMEGREFTESDDEKGLAVTVISEALARRYFHGESALGKRLKIGAASSNNPWLMVVGVVGNVRHDPYDRAPRPTIYRSSRQASLRAFDVAVRTSQDAATLGPAARAAVASLDPNLPVFGLASFQKVIHDQLTGCRFVAALMAVSGVLALALSSIGVYSVMAYSVVERTHEIGVRMALGAEERNVLWMVVQGGMTLAGVGLAIGAAAAFGMARMLSVVLFGVGTFDALAFGGGMAALVGAALAACYFPARRAARVDPVVALRHE